MFNAGFIPQSWYLGYIVSIYYESTKVLRDGADVCPKLELTRHVHLLV